MRVQPLHLTLVLVAAAMACAPPVSDSTSSATQEPCTLAAADLEAIGGMRAPHEAEVLAADWKAMSAVYSPDIVVMPPNQAEIIGRDSLLAWQETFPPVAEYELTFDEIDGCSDLAYVRGRYSMTLQPAGSAELVRNTGRWMWILRKDANGHWIVKLDMFNSTLPLSAPPE